MPSCRRWTPVLTAALVVAATGPLSATPASAAAPATRCSKLTGKDLVKSPSIKVVFRTVNTKAFKGRVFYGCTTATSKVRKLGNKGTFSGEVAGFDATFDFVKDAGTYLIVRKSLVDRSGAGTESYSRSVIDVGTGKTRELWSEATAEGGECQSPSDIGNPARFVINKNGIVAGVYLPVAECEAGGGKARVVVSVPGAPRTVIDTAEATAIPAGSLTLVGRTVGWTNAGVAKSKTL